MIVRDAAGREATRTMAAQELRDRFLLTGLFAADRLTLFYTDADRMIVGGVAPRKPVVLAEEEELASDHFTARRELGIVNVGAGSGSVEVSGERFELGRADCLYIGRGEHPVTFASDESTAPAGFYLVSCPAHAAYPTTKVTQSEAEQLALGEAAHSNKRTVYKYIHPAGARSCQLVLGITVLAAGNVWNTMPCHTHRLRSEVYLYYDMGDGLVAHFHGEPENTRHILVREKQAVISPHWSIHAGCGTQSYSFVWAMGGENQDFGDMQAVPQEALR